MNLEEEKIEWEIKNTPLACNYCGYEDPEYNWGDPKKVFDNCIGKICPKCGKPMLTKEDADKIKASLSCLEFANIEDGSNRN